MPQHHLSTPYKGTQAPPVTPLSGCKSANSITQSTNKTQLSLSALHLQLMLLGGIAHVHGHLPRLLRRAVVLRPSKWNRSAMGRFRDRMIWPELHENYSTCIVLVCEGLFEALCFFQDPSVNMLVRHFLQARNVVAIHILHERRPGAASSAWS